MKKLVINLIIFVIFLFIFLLIILATTGVETNKFNSFISEKVFQIKKINLELKTIKFKIDPKELSLFLETQNPKINYKENLIPAKNIKVYIDFLPLIKSNIKRETLVLKGKIQNYVLCLRKYSVEVNHCAVVYKQSSYRCCLTLMPRKYNLIY